MKQTLLRFLVSVFVGLATASAQTTASPPACAAPEHCQFDFWLGSWTVRSPDGKKTAGASLRASYQRAPRGIPRTARANEDTLTSAPPA